MRIDDPRLKKALLSLAPQRESGGIRVTVTHDELLTLAMNRAEISKEPMLLTVRERRMILRQRHNASYKRADPLGRAARFAQKLKSLIARKGLTQTDAAKLWNIPHKLLRRWTTEGIAQPSKRTADHLQRIGEELGLTDISQLWR